MFDYLNKVLYKTKGPDTSNIQESEEFVPFMIQRWSSMYSSDIACLINETSNRHWPVLTDKELWFNYLHAVIPQCRFKKIAYIKKKKDTEEKTKNKINVHKVASNLEISSREVNQYIEQFNLQIPNEQHQKR
jgi:hypothetical protein